MIISQTPFRISFFGGGSDYPNWYKYYGGEILSTTIDKYIYLTFRELPNFFPHRYRFVYAKIASSKNLKNLKFKTVREIIEYFKIKEGLEIHYDGDLPARSGMGSSSSFVVGMIKSIYEFKKKKVTPNILAKKSIFIEQKILKETVGIQDQIAASHGGFNYIKINKDGGYNLSKINISSKRINQLNENLFLVYSKMNRTANDIANSYVNKLTTTKEKQIKFIMESARIGKKILLSNTNIDDFGTLLHENWQRKKELSAKVSNKKINDLYNFAMEKGSIGGKILGAGGGGFFIFYVKKNKQKQFLNNIKTKCLVTNFNFTDKASQIIYNNQK